jgi:hypothetical protein
MIRCASYIPLNKTSASSLGLLSEVRDLSSGSVSLRLKGHFQCLTVDRPFYWLDIMDPEREGNW